MATSFGSFPSLGLFSQRYPPPLLPKPRKDNARLQKLLKRTAKKKASSQAAQSTIVFRSSLSPVNEASPDLEHSDHATPPKTPEMSLLAASQPPRFTVRPLYQHVSSPYPQMVGWGRPASFFPESPTAVPLLFPQQRAPVASNPPLIVPTPALLSQAVETGMPATASKLEMTIPVRVFAAHSVQGQSAVMPCALITPILKAPSPLPAPYSGGQAVIKPLTVLTLFGKPKSPRPTFRATETSKSPKPMFDVPQIRMYTANRSYYETSRTPPVYNTSELTSIGITPPRNKTPTAEIKRGTTPPAEVERGLTPTSDIKWAVTAISQSTSLSADTGHKTPLSEINGSATPIVEINRSSTPIVTQTLTPETKRIPVTRSEIKRAKTPTYEFPSSKTASGRSKTPSYHVTRVKTPVFEISRPNPLLFSVSPITVQPDRKTPTTAAPIINSQSVKPAPNDIFTPNGDIQLNITPEEPSLAKPIHEEISTPQSEASVAQEVEQKIPVAPPGYIENPPTVPSTPPMASHGSLRPTTPLYNAQQPSGQTHFNQRPRSPTTQWSKTEMAPVFQRPKTTAFRPPSPAVKKRARTPTHGGSKSSYRGLTPAEYVAHGGIKCYSPAFGLARDEVPGTNVTSAKTEPATVKSTGYDSSIPPAVAIPTITVSQASDVTENTFSSDKANTSPDLVTKKAAQTLLQDTLTSKRPTIHRPEVQTPATRIPKPETVMSNDVKQSEYEVPQEQIKVAVRDTAPAATEAVLPETKTKFSAEKALAGDLGSTKTQELKPSTPTPPEDSGPVLPATTPADSILSSVNKPAFSPATEPSSESKEETHLLSAAQPLLKVLQKPKGLKSKLSGWSRLKKHMVVEQEEPRFPEVSDQGKAVGEGLSEARAADERPSEKSAGDNDQSSKDTPVVSKMWDAVLFQMFSTKENIMHQIELNKSEDEKKKEKKVEPKEIPAFAHRLPVLLFSPRFDAKKLKEAASRPLTKISTVFEMGLIGRKNKEEEPKDFNRTARGFIVS